MAEYQYLCENQKVRAEALEIASRILRDPVILKSNRFDAADIIAIADYILEEEIGEAVEDWSKDRMLLSLVHESTPSGTRCGARGSGIKSAAWPRALIETTCPKCRMHWLPEWKPRWMESEQNT